MSDSMPKFGNLRFKKSVIALDNEQWTIQCNLHRICLKCAHHANRL